jgi:uncharacterized membrane protein HdeD (DUF308 family)
MRSGRHAPVVVGVFVALLAGLVLSVAHHAPRSAMPPARAIQTALHDAGTRQILAGSHWTRVAAAPLDGNTERVVFFRGPQIVAQVALQADGTVLTRTNDRVEQVPYGDWIAYQPAVLVGLCALFVLMTAVTPWRRVRNLDVVAALSLVVGVVLFQHSYVAASLLAAAPGLVWLLVRCAVRGFGPAGVPPRSVPLLAAITPGVDPERRVRWLRVLLVVLAVVFVMVSVSSPVPADVIYAVMQGATRLVHGVLPYGHMPAGVVHGDTYPILSYALYVPLALLSPVNTLWDSVAGGLVVAALAALVAAWTVMRLAAGPRARRRGGRPPEVEEAGLRAALAWLAFPPVLIAASTGTTDVVLGAMLALAVLLWRRPAAGAGLLALAGWFKLAPFALLPLSVASLRGRRLVAPLAAIGLVSVLSLGLAFAAGGVHGPSDMFHAVAYQFSRGSPQSVWSALGIDGLQPVGQACVVGLIAGAVVKLHREPELAHDRIRMAALSAAILIGLQLAADYWAFLYLAWVVPLMSCSLLAQPAALATAADPVAVLPGSIELSAAPVPAFRVDA